MIAAMLLSAHFVYIRHDICVEHLDEHINQDILAKVSNCY